MDALLIIRLAENEYESTTPFKKFRRQLLHTSLAKMLEALRPAMMVPEVVRCADGHFRRVVYGIGPYIADYPEQCMLACIVQGWCAR